MNQKIPGILSALLMMVVFSLAITLPVLNACIQGGLIEVAERMAEDQPVMQNILEEESEGKYFLTPLEGLPVTFNTLMDISLFDHTDFEHFVAEVPCPPPKS